MYNAICDAIHREMDSFEDKYSNGTQLSSKDLEDIDRMAHALKCIKTYEAMYGDYEDRGRRRYDYRRY